MNVLRYRTKPFDIGDDTVLWEQFMCFVRLFLPWEAQLDMLSDRQRPPMFAFIYESEVMGEGHIGFLELHGKFISINDVIMSLEKLEVEDKYIDNLKNLPEYFISADEICKKCVDEKEFEDEIEEMDNLYESHDARFYEYGSENIEDKIIEYVRKNHLEFFEYIK